MSRLVITIAALAFVSAASAACMHHTVVIVPAEDDFVIEKTCVMTACDASAHAARQEPDCFACYVSCAGSAYCFDPDSNCAGTCKYPACDHDKCEKHSYGGSGRSITPTPGVEDACQEAAKAYKQRCGTVKTEEQTESTNEWCKHEAMVDSSAAIPYFACLGATPCGERDDCEETSTFGDELCADLPNCPTYCDAGIREGLNRVASRLKPAFLALARTCKAEQSCEDVGACMQAWWKLMD